MGQNCYAANKADDSKTSDIIEKVKEFLQTNNFYFSSAVKIYNYGQESLKIQSDEDLENFVFQIIDHKELLRLLVITIKKIMQLMNFSVRIKSINNEDLPIIIIETVFLYLADPDRLEIQKEKLNIIFLLLNTEKSILDKKEKKLMINTRKFMNNIKLLVNILYFILNTYILLIVFLPAGQSGLDAYFENQDKQGLGMDDTLKWVYKIVESITNESVNKDKIIEKVLTFIEEPIREGNKYLFKLLVMTKNKALFNSEEGMFNLEIEQFYKVANQLQFIFNPINYLEYFILNKTGNVKG